MMLINGLINSIKRSPLVFTGLIVYLIIAFLCLEFLFINIFDIYRYSDKTFSQANENQYRLVDMADTSSVIRDFNSVINLKNFYNELNNCQDFVYYESIFQPTSIADFKGNDTFLYGYETNQLSERYIFNSREYDTVKQVLINYNTLQLSNIDSSILSGYSFVTNDFIMSDYNRIPIILGYDYNEEYEIGDSIDGILMQDIECSYEVIGFLNKDTNIIVNGELIYLDRYILSPSLIIESEPTTLNELMYHGFTYLQKINGTVEFINDDYSLKDFLIELEKLRLRHNIFEIGILNYSMVQINALKFLVYENAKTLLYIFTITFIFNIITILIYMLYKINLNLYVYKIYLLSGYGINDIKKMINFEILVPVSVAFILLILFLNIMLEEIFLLSSLFIICIYFLLLFMSIIITHMYFKNVHFEIFNEGEKYD